MKKSLKHAKAMYEQYESAIKEQLRHAELCTVKMEYKEAARCRKVAESYREVQQHYLNYIKAMENYAG